MSRLLANVQYPVLIMGSPSMFICICGSFIFKKNRPLLKAIHCTGTCYIWLHVS